jgi:23S rRNA-/tRNA-specific pseudouridylate synthase
VDKEYLAVVVGWPAEDRIIFEGAIEADPTSEFKMQVYVPGCQAASKPGNAVVCEVYDAAIAQRFTHLPFWF